MSEHKKLKVMTVVGTRPEIIRLARVLNKLDSSPAIEHILVHTGQNYDYELNQIFFDDMELRKPDHFLNASSNNASTTIGNTIVNIDEVLEKEKPDAFLVLGDTNSCLCCLNAKKRKIPIFHMEAGNRCFDQRVPEETNRKIVDHISDINLTYSDIAREYLLREGLPADRIIKTGSPMYEVLNYFSDKIENSEILKHLSLTPKNYFVVSSHREENISSDRNFSNLVKILNEIAELYKMPVILSTHPRTRKRIEEGKLEFNPLIQFLKPFSFTDYVKLQKNSKAVLSDSGTITEESSILKFPALNIREAHERPEGMEESAVMMVGMNPDLVINGLKQLEYEENQKTKFHHVKDYSMDNVSDKVVRIIISYTDYINTTVWKKNII
ncbi:MAG: UDP-N-acetylglucosamine 2-epimerase (non-hydrolyzing) [Bacteroidetes bacterium]|nr:UDP-N-acetylglucosamine 2-epimerase (non-hydrolyzing) [Bacteroidota bacterium]